MLKTAPIYVLLAALLLAALPAGAQGYKLPALYFPAGHSFCDTASWKLVFEDDFNGTELRAPWITFVSWAGMPGGDHANWANARTDGIAFYRDKNVFVKDGAAHLQAWKEPNAWRCDTCTGAAGELSYTTAILALPYTHAFNNGRFEARIKMPVFKWAHSTFWTWLGTTTNEIDIAEGYGISKNYLRWATAGKPHVTHSLHNWPAKEALESGAVHEEARGWYPKQEGIRGRSNRLNIGEYHVYACEWDTAVVRFFLDGQLVQEHWKYTNAGAPPGCIAGGGFYNQMAAFPANNESVSNVRLTLSIDRPDRRHPDGFLGEMLVDYVKIWQRHPEREVF